MCTIITNVSTYSPLGSNSLWTLIKSPLQYFSGLAHRNPHTERQGVGSYVLGDTRLEIAICAGSFSVYSEIFNSRELGCPHISHGTDTIMTLNDTGGIEIVPDHSVFCKH